MGAFDFRSPLPLLAVQTCQRMRPTTSADDQISLVTTYSRCKARRGPRSRGGSSRLPIRARRCCLLVRRDHRPTHQCKHFGTQLPSGEALPVPFAPRLLLCLRIKHSVTGVPARLNTRPVASGYLGGIRTRQTTRHCQAATSGYFRLEHFAGWGLHPLESAAFARRTPLPPLALSGASGWCRTVTGNCPRIYVGRRFA